MTNKNDNAQANTQALTKAPNDNDNTRTNKNLAKRDEITLFADIEPWAEPVDGVALANDIKNLFDRYLYLSNGASAAITMWVLHSYSIDCFDISPRLYISSPMPGCGKTTLMDLIELLSYNSLSVSNITAAAMFRIIAEHHPTLLIDEADTFLKNNEELRGVINSGYEQGGKVSRVETINKKQVVSLFPCYAPCAIAGIGGTHKTIQERSVNIIMERKTHADHIERLRKREIRATTSNLQRKCLRWIKDNAEQITFARPEMPLYMGDRTADIWEPLFAIAGTISSDWLQQINAAAKQLNNVQPNDDETSMRFQLLADIKTLFDLNPTRNRLPSTWLVEELKKMEESPWAEYGFGRGLSVYSLAKQLKFFNILPKQIRNAYERHRCFFREDFEDAFNRYLPENTVEPAQPTDTQQWHNGTLETVQQPVSNECHSAEAKADPLECVNELASADYDLPF